MKYLLSLGVLLLVLMSGCDEIPPQGDGDQNYLIDNNYTIPPSECSDNDGICPSTCTYNNDSDCPLPTCDSAGGRICTSSEECTGEIIPASDTTNCCSICSSKEPEITDPCKDISCGEYEECIEGTCELKTCSDIGGSVCTSNEQCNTSPVSTSDSNLCCLGSCTQVAEQGKNWIMIENDLELQYVCEKRISNEDPNEKINLFFFSDGFYDTNIASFHQNVDWALDWDQNNGGLFSIVPYNEYKESFNIFKISSNEIFNCMTSHNSGPNALPCDVSLFKEIIQNYCGVEVIDQIIIIGHPNSPISPDEKRTGAYNTGLLSVISAINLDDPLWIQSKVIHETGGHGIGGLGDEFAYLDTYKEFWIAKPNIDQPGCPKWCSGVMNTTQPCYNTYVDWLDCVQPFLDQTCLDGNVNYDCGISENIRSCYNQANETENSQGRFLYECNLGQGCLDGTGCFWGGGYSFANFRSIEKGIMKASYDNNSFGPIGESIIQSRITGWIEDRNSQNVCGNNIREGTEMCDGTDLGGNTCESQGFYGGVLSCNTECELDVSQCEANVCGNGDIETGEDCDGPDLGGLTCEILGFDGGTLTCNEDCQFSGCYNEGCGNGISEGNEECDGSDFGGNSCAEYGFLKGILICSPDCTIDTSACNNCGNGVREGTEDCDGTDLGELTCVDLGFDSGVLSCKANCTLDASACAFGSSLVPRCAVVPNYSQYSVEYVNFTESTPLVEDSIFQCPPSGGGSGLTIKQCGIQDYTASNGRGSCNILCFKDTSNSSIGALYLTNGDVNASCLITAPP